MMALIFRMFLRILLTDAFLRFYLSTFLFRPRRKEKTLHPFKTKMKLYLLFVSIFFWYKLTCMHFLWSLKFMDEKKKRRYWTIFSINSMKNIYLFILQTYISILSSSLYFKVWYCHLRHNIDDFSDSQVGIITPYRNQRFSLIRYLREVRANQVEVNTVDGFQVLKKFSLSHFLTLSLFISSLLLSNWSSSNNLLFIIIKKIFQ